MHFIKPYLKELFIPIIIYSATLSFTAALSIIVYLRQKTKSVTYFTVGLVLLSITASLIGLNRFYYKRYLLQGVQTLLYAPSLYFIFLYFKTKKTMSFKCFIPLLLLCAGTIIAQPTQEEIVYQGPINDNTIAGQKDFVNDLMTLAGYAVDEISVYQNLSNYAKIFRVIYNEESQSGFIFIRWDKKKKENYIANKMIDPKVYYNLKAAKEVMREQTDKKAFNVDDIALQAPDQEPLSTEDLEGLRQEYDLQQEEKKLRELEKVSKKGKRKKDQ